MEPTVFEYHLRPRGPAIYLAMGLCLVACHKVWVGDLTPLVLLVVVPVLAKVLCRLCCNRIAGIRLGAGRLEVIEGETARSYPLARIRQARLHRRWFGPGFCTLDLGDGHPVDLPVHALPPTDRLRAELRRQGVPVTG